MPDYKYDAAEAKFLLNDYAEHLRRSREAATKASLELLGDLLKLMQEYGFHPDVLPGTNDIEFHMANRKVVVGLDGVGLYVAGQDGVRVRPRTVYDRTAQVMRSTEKDSSRAAVPGEAVPYRSALAELVHTTITVMERFAPKG